VQSALAFAQQRQLEPRTRHFVREVLHLGSCEGSILTGSMSQVVQLLEAIVQQQAEPAR
jgi:hypothetical protein